MPIAATLQAAPSAQGAGGADAGGRARMAALPTGAHSRALEAWIRALLLALLGHIEPLRQIFPHIAQFELPDDEAAALRLIRHAIRAENRLRARIGWLFRQHPNRAMRRTFAERTPDPRAKPARAPPARARAPAPIPQNPRRKPRLRRR